MYLKEDFCVACLAIPLAFIGAGVTTYSNSQRKYKYMKKVSLIGLIFTGISLVVGLMYYSRCNNCR